MFSTRYIISELKFKFLEFLKSIFIREKSDNEKLEEYKLLNERNLNDMVLNLLKEKNDDPNSTIICILYKVDSFDREFYMVHDSTITEISKELFYDYFLHKSKAYLRMNRCRFYKFTTKENQLEFNSLYEFMTTNHKTYSELNGKLGDYIDNMMIKFQEKFPSLSILLIPSFHRSITLYN